MVIMRRELLACAVSFLVIIQIGCGSVSIGRESTAECEVRGDGSGAGNESLLAVDGVANNLRTFGLLGIIVPFVPFWFTGDDKAELTIYLTFSPGAPDAFSLDARQVYLLTDNGDSVSPKEVQGPFIDLYDPTLPKAKNGPFAVSKKLAIHLTFPIAPLHPADRFTLVLKGLSSSSQSIEAPNLNFSKQTFLGVTYTLGLLCPHCSELIKTKWVLSH